MEVQAPCFGSAVTRAYWGRMCENGGRLGTLPGQSIGRDRGVQAKPTQLKGRDVALFG